MKELPTISEVVAATSRVTTIPVEILLNPSYRARHVTRARHIAAFVARNVTCKTWSEINTAFNVEHPSALVGAKKIEQYLADKDPDVKRAVDGVMKTLKR